MSEGRQGDARAYIRLRGSTHCPTPAKQKRRSPSYTRDARGLPEELKGRQRNAREMPGRHQGVRPISFAMHIIIRLPCKRNGMELKGRQRSSKDAKGTSQGHQRNASAYIRPLGSVHYRTPATQKQRSPSNAKRTPEGRQGLYPTP